MNAKNNFNLLSDISKAERYYKSIHPKREIIMHLITAITWRHGCGKYELHVNHVFCLMVSWSRDMVKTIVGKRGVVWGLFVGCSRSLAKVSVFVDFLVHDLVGNSFV